MGFNRRFRFVYDAARYRADFVLVCPRCRHRVVIERRTLISIFAAWRINPLIENAQGRLRCTACRRRGCIIEITQEGSSAALQLREGDSLPVKGVSISQWCRMDENERRRLRRLARG